MTEGEGGECVGGGEAAHDRSSAALILLQNCSEGNGVSATKRVSEEALTPRDRAKMAGY